MPDKPMPLSIHVLAVVGYVAWPLWWAFFGYTIGNAIPETAHAPVTVLTIFVLWVVGVVSKEFPTA